jgi:hypothetical protein
MALRKEAMTSEDMTVEDLGREAQALLGRCEIVAALGLVVTSGLLKLLDMGVEVPEEVARPLPDWLRSVIERDEVRLGELRELYLARKDEVGDLETIFNLGEGQS